MGDPLPAPMRRELAIVRGFAVKRARYRSAVARYVIRGGEEGKARLSVLSAALAPSTASLLGAAGVREGMRCARPRVWWG